MRKINLLVMVLMVVCSVCLAEEPVANDKDYNRMGILYSPSPTMFELSFLSEKLNMGAGFYGFDKQNKFILELNYLFKKQIASLDYFYLGLGVATDFSEYLQPSMPLGYLKRDLLWGNADFFVEAYPFYGRKYWEIIFRTGIRFDSSNFPEGRPGLWVIPTVP